MFQNASILNEPRFFSMPVHTVFVSKPGAPREHVDRQGENSQRCDRGECVSTQRSHHGALHAEATPASHIGHDRQQSEEENVEET